MPVIIRKSQERGFFDHGWLKTYHTFSFGDYYDQRFMGYRSLRVINEDQVIPKAGFPSHSHKDMEILSVVIDGQLAHKDSLGNSTIIQGGEIQMFSAGYGVTHSEYNASEVDPVHFLQIWIIPDRRGLEPTYQQKKSLKDIPVNEWALLASRSGKDDSSIVHQDVFIYKLTLEESQKQSRELPIDRYGWIQVIHGAVRVNGIALQRGDGAAIHSESKINLSADKNSELLFFDLN